MTLNEYSSLNQSETKYLNILLRGAAVRILVTRLHDMIYHPKDALVIPKDPKIGNIFSSFIQAVGRNPAARSEVFTMTMLGFALVEAIALFALVIALVILFINSFINSFNCSF